MSNWFLKATSKQKRNGCINKLKLHQFHARHELDWSGWIRTCQRFDFISIFIPEELPVKQFVLISWDTPFSHILDEHTDIPASQLLAEGASGVKCICLGFMHLSSQMILHWGIWRDQITCTKSARHKLQRKVVAKFLFFRLRHRPSDQRLQSLLPCEFEARTWR